MIDKAADAQRILLAAARPPEVAPRPSRAADANDRPLAHLRDAPPLTPLQIVAVLDDAYRRAHETCRANVEARYARAFHDGELIGAGVPLDLPRERLDALRNHVWDGFLDKQRPGGMLNPHPGTAPNAMEAMRLLDSLAETGSVPPLRREPKPRAPRDHETPSSCVTWQQIGALRDRLEALGKGAATAADAAAMRRIVDIFDEEMGRTNSLLGEARSARLRREQLFDPERTNCSPHLRQLLASDTPGRAIYEALFEGAPPRPGDTTPVVEHLRRLFGEGSGALAALRQAALQRLVVDPASGKALSPHDTATAIRQTMNRPGRELYEALFPAEDIARLSHYGDALDILQPKRRVP